MMHLIPFRQQLDEAFQRDRALWLKMAGGAAVMAFVVLAGWWRMNIDGKMGTGALAWLLAGAVLVGPLLVLLLALKDVVRRRRAEGRPVPWLLRCYFAYGAWSLLAWFATCLLLAPLALALLFAGGFN